jgi:hypothetical protein
MPWSGQTKGKAWMAYRNTAGLHGALTLSLCFLLIHNWTLTHSQMDDNLSPFMPKVFCNQPPQPAESLELLQVIVTGASPDVMKHRAERRRDDWYRGADHGARARNLDVV